MSNPFKFLWDKFYTMFLWSSGADLEVLDQVPMEKNKFYGIGGTIVFTALMATFAGGYAFYTAFDDVYPSIFFGFFWGALIFNLDRYIVSSFGVGDGKKTISGQEMIEAAPRLMMAIILGLVISTPLELKLFESEINAEIKRLNDLTTQESEFNYTAQADSLAITFIKENQSIEEGIDLRRQELEVLRLKRNDAYDKYMCELNGTCGTGRPGEGPVFREAKENYINLNEEFKNMEASYGQLNEQDLQGIREKEGRINNLRDEARQKSASLRTEFESRNGLLARLEALGSLTDKDSSLWAAKWLVTILFVFIEIAPILFKMMTERGPYDDIIDYKKHQVKVRHMLLTSNLNEEVNTDVKINAEKSSQKLEAELLANRELLKTIALAQSEIAAAAIAKWKEGQIQKARDNPDGIITS
ncbi:uncharacterized protein DUF4407 [Algoriphagus antarcticus]|uniref:Uncharacterized protein DUF4407 n=2 Tax=Algoriphagus antarcticus TaxID=238540 RepID=A0A3E0DQB3_9BACT|nr:uncharacterized protein DUF4407 [Algoriphagus antarcticus]